MFKAVLMLNLGTPATPTPKGLREFYRHFFADPFVFDFNPLARWLLRNLIILPFRAPRVARDYASIWMKDGSPLKVYADRMQTNVQAAFDASGEEVMVLNAMAYSEPFITQVMSELERRGIEEIVLLPMFPQYSTATTASVFDRVKKSVSKWEMEPRLIFVDDLFQEPAFIRAWSILISKHLEGVEVDHVIFSYHGVPQKTIKRSDAAGVCTFGDCCNDITAENRYCYRAQCVATTESIIAALGWNEVSHSVAFQSRFGPLPWVQPYLDEHILELVGKGVNRLAVITPSFVSDCLETIHEIGVKYQHQFKAAGGETFLLLPNLNDDQDWFDAVFEISHKHLTSQD
ncbi:MAG TPA: ferrochelatase [Gammaproteobacteria bacterium]|jgi:ferrochelatase|nr:ferrochelatase [Gammaproteobacteria bacterium]MDP6733265.1 ferrochelatase [Gammaproteobacteria bacterium]HAJ75673.1 ferrochelatase [Gammaproteobacteria bacterium]|tara:strand:- start:3686 stop:4720 length:1035 start_codon:yes stop_codon:yes gene_type:complete